MSETRWIAGINAVAAALEHDPERVLELRVESGQRNSRVEELVTRARAFGIPVQHANAESLARGAGVARHQGVIAHYRAAHEYNESDLSTLLQQAGTAPLLLVLDGVQDPHNLGACLRSAAAAGAAAVIVPRDRAAGLTPTVHKTSAGAADRIPLLRVTNLARVLRDLKRAGFWLTGLAGEASQSLYGLDLRGPLAIVMGGEGEGLRRLTREHCDFLARIPLAEGVESLNVSVATGIALFEARRQRG